MKYRVIISTYLTVNANSKGEAENEVIALQEGLADNLRLPSTEEKELMLNSEIINIEEEHDE